MLALVSSGIADIGIGDFTVTKERSEVVAFTETIAFGG
jgi:ABC-type amino acid transport substrate-binding protein